MRVIFALPLIAVGSLCAADPVPVSSSTAVVKIVYNNATIVSSISASVATTNGSIWMPPRTRSQFGYKYNGTTNADGVMRLTGGTMVDKDLVNLVPVYSSNVSTAITMKPGGEYDPICGRKEFTSTNLVGFMDWWIAETTTQTVTRIKLDADGNVMRDSMGNIIYENVVVVVPTGKFIKKTHGTACAANFAGMLKPTATSRTVIVGGSLKKEVSFGYIASWPSYITYPVAADNNKVTIGNSEVLSSKPTNFLSGTRPAVFKMTITNKETIKWEIAGKAVVVNGSSGVVTNQ